MTGARPGRTVLHSLPTGFALDATRGINDPHGMVGEKLGVDMHVVSGDQNAVRNLMLAVERCHLDVEAVVATPYAAGLAALVDDEAEMGVVVVDFGGGTTSVGVFAGGHLVHTDSVAVGGNHITMDIARGPVHQRRPCRAAEDALRLDHRHRLRRPRDDRGRLGGRGRARRGQPRAQVPPRADHPAARRGDPRARARPAEGGGLLGRDRPARGAHGRRRAAHRACRSWRARILSKQVRIGRPLGVQGLPEAAKGPSFAAPVGLLVYPQVAALEHFVPRQSGRVPRHRHGRLPVAHGAVDQGQFLELRTRRRRGGRAPVMDNNDGAAGRPHREARDNDDQSAGSGHPGTQAPDHRVRRRRRRRQRRQQHDRARPAGLRVRRRQHRCPGAHLVEGRPGDPDGRAGDRGPRRRLAAGSRPRGRRRGHRRDPRPARRRAHGVRHRRHGRRHRHGLRPRSSPARPATWASSRSAS